MKGAHLYFWIFLYTYMHLYFFLKIFSIITKILMQYKRSVSISTNSIIFTISKEFFRRQNHIKFYITMKPLHFIFYSNIRKSVFTYLGTYFINCMKMCLIDALGSKAHEHKHIYRCIFILRYQVKNFIIIFIINL